MLYCAQIFWGIKIQGAFRNPVAHSLHIDGVRVMVDVAVLMPEVVTLDVCVMLREEVAVVVAVDVCVLLRVAVAVVVAVDGCVLLCVLVAVLVRVLVADVVMFQQRANPAWQP